MSILNSLKYDQWYRKLSASAKTDLKVQKDVLMRRFNNEVSYLLAITLVIIRRINKAQRIDRGAETPTGRKLPDFTLYLHVF